MALNYSCAIIAVYTILLQNFSEAGEAREMLRTFSLTLLVINYSPFGLFSASAIKISGQDVFRDL